MHAKYAEQGLRILGFPCNQFGNQVSGYGLMRQEGALGLCVTIWWETENQFEQRSIKKKWKCLYH